MNLILLCGFEIWVLVHVLLGLGIIANIVYGRLSGYKYWAMTWVFWMWGGMMQ